MRLPLKIEDGQTRIEERVAAFCARLEHVLKTDCPTCRIESDEADACEFRGGRHCRFRREVVTQVAWDYVLDPIERLYNITASDPGGALAQLPRIDWRLEHLYSGYHLERLAEEGTEALSHVTDPIERFTGWGIPVRLLGHALTSRWTEAARLALRLSRREGVLLALSGLAGVGKSVAAAVAMIAVGSGRWIRAPALTRPPQEGEPEPESDASTPGLVVLDDVGIEHSPSGYAAARICDIVELREAAMLRTIITTNLDAKAFKKQYGERLASRINGDALGWQHVAGPDHRASRHLQVVSG